jgi:outer membrane protein assembly factor BamD (BamD/ComL family)
LLLADLYSNTGQAKKALEELETFAKLDPASSYMPRVQATMEKLRQPN